MDDSQKIDGSYVELLLELKTAIMRQLKVATLGLVKSVPDATSHQLKVKPFPLMEDETEKYITCFSYLQDELNVDDTVLVLFVDRNFINNLKRIERNDKVVAKIQDTKLHSEEYGIVIQKIV